MSIDGLLIADKLIKFISGPISCTLLTPLSYDTYQSKGLELPIILLFGDTHFSFDNMCNFPTDKPPLVDGICEPDKGCYKIYSPEFLQALNQLAEGTYPIDIYGEFQKGSTIRSIQGPIARFLDENKSCFLHETKSTSACRYKNLRWHYSDVRHIKGTFMESMTIYDSILVYFSSNIINTSILYRSYVVQNLTEEGFNTVFRVLKAFIPKTGSRGNINNMVYEIFRILLLNPNDKIIKQINSQIEELRSIKLWADIIIQTFIKYNERILTIHNLQEMKKVVSYLERLEDNSIETILSNHDFIQIVNQIKKIILCIRSLFVDIYTILRMFKKPTPKLYHKPNKTDELNPTLSICYFGHIHCRSIEYILRSLSMYQSILSVEHSNPISRCIDVSNQNLNLSELFHIMNRQRRQTIKTDEDVSQEELYKDMVSTLTEFSGRKNRYIKYY